MLLVLMDNATAEYTFLASFFAPPPKVSPVVEPQSAALFPAEDREMRRVSANTDDVSSPPPGHERFSTSGTRSSDARDRDGVLSKEEEAALASTWKQILEPTLTYCQVRITLYYLLNFIVFNAHFFKPDICNVCARAFSTCDLSPHHDQNH